MKTQVIALLGAIDLDVAGAHPLKSFPAKLRKISATAGDATVLGM